MENLTLTADMDPAALETRLEEGLCRADECINRNYLIRASEYKVIKTFLPEKDWAGNIRLFRITRIVYDKKENTNDKLISVFSSLQNIKGSVFLVVRGTETGVSLYLGVQEGSDNTTVAGSAERLHDTFLSNFPGSRLVSYNVQETTSILEECVKDEGQTRKSISCVNVIPSPRDKEKDKFVQGMEKFIDTMQRGKKNYTAILVAKAVRKEELESRKRGLENMYSSLSPMAKTTLAYGENESDAVTKGTSENFSHSVSSNISKTNGTNEGKNFSYTQGSNHSLGFGGGGMTSSSGGSTSQSRGFSSGQSWSQSVSKGTSDSTSTGTSASTSQTKGSSKTMTVEHQNKSVAILMEKIDAQLKRIKSSEAYGLWECAAYFISSDVSATTTAASSYQALMCGEESDVENSFINTWSSATHRDRCGDILTYVKQGKHPLLQVQGGGIYLDQLVTPSALISGKELPLLMGLPQKSVSGVSVSTMTAFGRNVILQNSKSDPRLIHLGNVYHMGQNEPSSVDLDLDSFTSHCFVTGSTGSGKSNTTYALLYEILKYQKDGVHFLVIEPAKGEYKDEFCNLPGINIFTTNPRLAEMLKLNPFRFNHPQIHILEHLDRLIEIFNACWEMYAAMPAILKDAVEQIYIQKGWDLLNSIYLGEGEPQYPTFQDLMTTLPNIINNSGYSSDTKGDYVGALVTRVTSLTNGISGQIFCDSYDIEDQVLFDQNTIVDLSRVGSSETKSLIMGILVLKLSEYRMAMREGANSKLKHVTVMEEAHNLLKNVKPGEGGSNVVGKSVEMICNNIAEMRTYGEGFIIVDQSPSSVDIAAIKNTNTKIVMRLPEKNDREAVGNSIGLDEEQIKELSRLEVGKAAVMQNNWQEAVLTSIDRAPSSYRGSIQEEPYDNLTILRGASVDAIIDQYHHGYDLPRALRSIDCLNVGDHKKKEFRRCLTSILEELKRNERKPKEYPEYLSSLLQISGAKNLLTSMHGQLMMAKHSQDFNTTPCFDEVKLQQWNQEFIQRLTHYVDLQENTFAFLSRELLRAAELQQPEFSKVTSELKIEVFKK